MGSSKGDTLVTKKSIEAKETIRKHYKDYNRSLQDAEAMELCEGGKEQLLQHKQELSEL